MRKFAWSNKCTVLVYVGRGEQELKGGGHRVVTKKDDALTDTEKSENRDGVRWIVCCMIQTLGVAGKEDMQLVWVLCLPPTERS